MLVSNIWDDSDLTVNEETSDSMPSQTPNKTRQFNNTLKSNKGKVKPGDLPNYTSGRKGPHQFLSALNIPMQSLNEELKLEGENQGDKKYLKPLVEEKKPRKLSSNARDGAEILSSLRKIPSNELLKRMS
ncbi:unnamed protein product [Moneuplotes crassus]|uniref:Uncharacterized protein n=1 Tax=Euplotes crassus TaxID=5936 RepID=A0AAD1XAA3_EUPCR|nr:unnamed protein product [Moneuplotes crassus]